MRLAAVRTALQTRYPINFVVKHPNRLVCFVEKARPEAVRNLPDQFELAGLFPDRRHLSYRWRRSGNSE